MLGCSGGPRKAQSVSCFGRSLSARMDSGSKGVGPRTRGHAKNACRGHDARAQRVDESFPWIIVDGRNDYSPWRVDANAEAGLCRLEANQPSITYQNWISRI